MTSFVPAQFSAFTSNFDFDKFKTGTSSSFSSRLQQLRKPNDFFDFSRMSKPSGVFDIQRRVTYNLSYFASNYILIVAIVSLYLIVTNFPLLIVIVFDVASIYGIQKVFGNADELDLKYFTVHKNVLYTIIFIANLPVLFISSPITTLMWLVLVSASIVLVHASLMDKPVEASYSDAV